MSWEDSKLIETCKLVIFSPALLEAARVPVQVREATWCNLTNIGTCYRKKDRFPIRDWLLNNDYDVEQKHWSFQVDSWQNMWPSTESSRKSWSCLKSNKFHPLNMFPSSQWPVNGRIHPAHDPANIYIYVYLYLYNIHDPTLFLVLHPFPGIRFFISFSVFRAWNSGHSWSQVQPRGCSEASSKERGWRKDPCRNGPFVWRIYHDLPYFLAIKDGDVPYLQ